MVNKVVDLYVNVVKIFTNHLKIKVNVVVFDNVRNLLIIRGVIVIYLIVKVIVDLINREMFVENTGVLGSI